jgi:hypothetical protein
MADDHSAAHSTLAAAGVEPATSAEAPEPETPSTAATEAPCDHSPATETVAACAPDAELGSADVTADPLDERDEPESADGGTASDDARQPAAVAPADEGENSAQGGAAVPPLAEQLPLDFQSPASTGGVFAAFTPPIPRGRPTAAAADLASAATTTATQARSLRATVAELADRLPVGRPRGTTVIGLAALAFIVMATAIGGSPASRPATAPAGRSPVPRTADASTANRRRPARRTRLAVRGTHAVRESSASRAHTRARARAAKPVVVRRVADPAVAGPVASPPPTIDNPPRRLPALAQGSEFRP